jgi:protease I
MHILMMTGDAGESQEIYYPKFRLEEEGWSVIIAAPTKKTLKSVVHDFEPDFDTFTEKPGYRIEADAAFEDIDPANYRGLVLPGGRAPEYLRTNSKAIELVRHFTESRKPVAAICHGQLLLLAAGYGSGCRMTAYPALEYDVRAAGASFEDREVIRDANVVTSRGWPDNGPWMREFVRLLKEGNG